MTLRKAPEDQTSEELRVSYKALDYFIKHNFGERINYVLLIRHGEVSRVMSNQPEAVVVSALKLAAHGIEHGQGYEIPTEVH